MHIRLADDHILISVIVDKNVLKYIKRIKKYIVHHPVSFSYLFRSSPQSSQRSFAGYFITFPLMSTVLNPSDLMKGSS